MKSNVVVAAASTGKDPPLVPVGVTLPPAIIDWMDSERGDISRSHFARRILLEKYEKMKRLPQRRRVG